MMKKCRVCHYPPAHDWVLQDIDSEDDPAQSLPPPEEGGLSQERVLVFIPVPHASVQVSYDPHSPHWPFTNEIFIDIIRILIL